MRTNVRYYLYKSQRVGTPIAHGLHCSYRAARSIAKHAGQAELQLEINTDQRPLISFHSVFYQLWSELGAKLSKQPAHLGVCYKLLSFVFLSL